MLLLRTFCTIGKVSTTFLNRVTGFVTYPGLRVAKNGFLRFSRKLSTLDHMLLYSTYINMATAHILLYKTSLYDLQGPSYEFRKITQLAHVKK